MDKAFWNVDDLSPNVLATGREAYGSWPSDTIHGTFVASVIGARGDNQIGMTGMMWNAGLALYDAWRVPGSEGVPIFQPFLSIQQAATDGARVINLSLGVGWRRRPRAGNENDILRAQQFGNVFLQTVLGANGRLLAEGRPRPLYVIAAGNDGVDAWWSGFPQIAGSISTQVLVVAASTSSSRLWNGSNRNVDHSLVEVAAPGRDVRGLGSASEARIETGTGTSFAAPLVSGLAGLLFSFEPRLSASDVKTFIVEGAARGGRTADGIPIIDAYESLKAAAGRVGAPLCGNRIWAEPSGRLMVERAGEDEAIATGVTSEVRSMHGGRRLVYLRPAEYQNHLLEYRDGSWLDQPLRGKLDESGSSLSAAGVTHEVDHQVLIKQVVWNGQPTPPRVDLVLRDLRNGTEVVVRSMEGFNPNYVGNLDPVGCGAISPRGDKALIPLARGGGGPVDYHLVDLASGADRVLYTAPSGSGNMWFSGAFSEDGKEVMVHHAISYTFDGPSIAEFIPLDSIRTARRVATAVPSRPCRGDVPGGFSASKGSADR